MSHRTSLSILGALALAALVCPWSELLADKATSRDLGGADRFLTHVSTDKPIYRPGETLYVRGVLLNAATHAPIKQDMRVQSRVEIKGPKGDTVASGFAPLQDSVLGFTWKVPGEQPGGEYTIRVSYPGHGHAPAERKFDIRAYRAPRLKSQIVFLRDGYGPGDTVGATLHVERAEGGIPVGAKVTAIARVDGSEVFRGPARVDAQGNCSVRFPLPQTIARGEGSLAMVIEDGGIVETASKTIPILLQTVDLNLYPEGGDLVAGLPARVYIAARTPAQKPADLAGVIVDAAGRQVATFRTEHEGRGRFAFTPAAGESYTLKITEPSGIKTTYPLPAVKAGGAVISAAKDRYARREPVKLTVGSTSGGTLLLTLAKREVELSALAVEVRPGEMTEVVLTPPSNADGVLIATVWDDQGNPLAERLIYRQPAKSLRIEVTADRTTYVPGENVNLIVKTTDHTGRPVSAVVGLTVTDDSVLEMIEKREQAPRLPVMVLVESDVRELADAHVYLDPDNAEAPLALDLLLGTQGWRRFAFMDTAKFLARHGSKARRVLALRMSTRRELRKVASIRPRRWAQRGALMAVPEDEPAAALPPPVPMAPRAPQPPAEPAEVAAGPAPEMARKPMDADAKGMMQAMGEAEIAGDREEDILGMGREKRKLARRRHRRIALRQDFVAVRVYAHAVRPGRKPGDRRDFTETLYWNTGVRTSAKTGQATVRFALNDSITTFRVFADAFAASGALGEGTHVIESVEPFYIEPKLPLEVTFGDVIELPVGIVNGVPSDLLDGRLSASVTQGIRISGTQTFTLDANTRERRILRLIVDDYTGVADIILRASAGSYSDRVTRTFVVKPLGFPIEVAAGGMIGPGAAVAKTVVIPADVAVGSITTNIAVYPTPLANLTEALQRLMREPSGCFEQASSTTYPLVMAQQYFLSHAGVDPSLVERSRTLLDKGYKRLIGFECKQRGYEWFAGDPGHEALSAYGLLEFTDMAQVRQVDEQMLARTRRWLLGTRDGEGGFSRKRRALHRWITDRDCSNGYILWALLESGEKGVSLEIASFKAAAAKSANSYVLALAANVMALAGEKDAARKLMDRLVAQQVADGHVDGATTTIVGSGGQALQIETTSLAVLAWLREAAYTGAVEKAIRYLADSCKAGRYGSTQSTVLALRAIVTYDKSRARPKSGGTLRIYVNGKPVGRTVSFDAKTQGAIKMPEFSELLEEPGTYKVELRMENGSAMPYALAVNYNTLTPASAPECQVRLAVSLRDAKIEEGAITEADVVVTNLADKAVPTPVAIVGIPGGLEPRHDQLKELVKSGAVDAYEVLGREVVLYWRELRAGQKVALPLSLVAAVPGTYTAPASRAYLYYTDEFKHWLTGLKVTITPRAMK